MPERHLLSLISLFIVLVLSGCGEPEPIRIGLVGQLSGRQSEIGVSVRNGVQLRLDQINRAGGINGRPLLLVVKDNKGDQAECSRILDEMIDDNIKIIIGPMFSQMAEVAAKVTKDKDVLLLSPTMSTDYLTGKDDNILRTSATTNQQGHFLAEKALEDGMRSIAVVYDLNNRKYTEFLYKSFRETLEPHGVTFPVVLTIQKSDSTPMLPLARKIYNANPDGVLMCLAALDAANLSQQLRKIGGSMQFYGVSWSQTTDLIQHGGRAVENMVLVATRKYGVVSPELARFNADYIARYKIKPSFAAIRGYDAFSLLATGLEKAKNLTPSMVKHAILSLYEFYGISSRMELDEYGDVKSGYFLVRVSGGIFVDE